MNYKINFYPELCVACSACCVACMDQNDIRVQDGALPFRKAFQTEYKENGKVHIGYFSASCQHCQERDGREASTCSARTGRSCSPSPMRDCT